jgi:hypothetical protein
MGFSPFPEKDILGKNGWIFSGNYFDKGTDKFLGHAVFPGEELEAKFQFIRGMQKVAEGKWIPFVFVIAPDKSTIYPENLPDWARRSDPAKRPSRIITKLARRENLEFIHLEETLLAAKRRDPKTLLYYRHDSHWNRAGAWHGFEMLMENLKKQSPNFKIPRAKIIHGKENKTAQERLDFHSFLAQAVGEDSNVFDSPQILFMGGGVGVDEVGKWQTFDLEVSHLPKKLFNEEALNKEHLLFIRDSFGTALASCLTRTFAQITMVHNLNVTNLQSFQEWVDQINPDVVIYEIVERRVIE